MWLVFLLLTVLCYASNVSKEDNINELGYDSTNETLLTRNVEESNNTKESDSLEDHDETNFTIPWDTYIALLIKESIEQLENIKSNIKKNYKLTEIEIKDVDEAFQGSNTEYEHMLQYNLKLLIDHKKFNDTIEFMIDFTDLSNYLLMQIVEYNLERVKGKLLTPTKWYKQVMRQKILRQQSKIATNYIESQICYKLSVCKERWFYSEYLVEWLRLLLNVNSFSLNSLFSAIPEILKKNMHTIKTNVKFKKTVNFIVTSNVVVQRDTLDYLDEVITNQQNIVNIVPDILRKGAVLLIDLFKTIDDNYDMNQENEDQLENITQMLNEWIRGETTQIHHVLEMILSNMALNLKIWPLDMQRRVDLIWSKITIL